MVIGSEMVFMVNTNKKYSLGIPLRIQQRIRKGSSYLVLTQNYVFPRDRPIVSIGYKYNMHKVISFVVKYNIGRINSSINYLSKYSNPFKNISIFPVYRPLFVYKFFGSVNEVHFYNKYRQSGLVLENYWVAQCGMLFSGFLVSVVKGLLNKSI